MNDTKKISPQAFEELKKLKDFARFVLQMKESTEKDKEHIKTIIGFLEHPETFPTLHWDWNICIDIHDEHLMNNPEDRCGVCSRRWWVFCESNMLTIQTSSKLSHGMPWDYYKPHPDLEIEFYFSAGIIWPTDWVDQLNLFIEDAPQYKKYMNEYLNSLEIDVDVYLA